MEYQSIKNIDLDGQVVGIRVDFNVPLDKNGNITETTRIDASIKTLRYLIEKSEIEQLHIFTHLGRPGGIINEKFSLKPVYEYLKEEWRDDIDFVKNLKNSGKKIQLHENMRFYAGEKENSPALIEKILDLDLAIFVNEAFSVSHRAHASVVGPASFLPVYPGFLLAKEIEIMSPYISSEKQEKLAVVIGGVKINTKIGVLKHFAKTAEDIVIGGALANTFLAALGKEIGGSLYEEDEIRTALKVLKIAEEYKTKIHLPDDVVVANNLSDSDDVNICDSEDTPKDKMILDIGPKTIGDYKKVLSKAKTIIWNGPLGCFEYDKFEEGTREILKVVAAAKSAQTILGGGDTLEALKQFHISQKAFSHVSTGGGAMLKFLEGKDLPGLEILELE